MKKSVFIGIDVSEASFDAIVSCQGVIEQCDLSPAHHHDGWRADLPKARLLQALLPQPDRCTLLATG